MHRCSFHHGTDLIARLQLHFRRRLCRDDGHEFDAAIQSYPRQRLRTLEGDNESPRDGYILGADAGEQRARFAAIGTLQFSRPDGEREQAAIALHDLRRQHVFYADGFGDLGSAGWDSREITGKGMAERGRFEVSQRTEFM